MMTSYCRITVPKTDKTWAAAEVLENAGIIFDTYDIVGRHSFLATIELYDGNRAPIRQIYDAIAAAADHCESLMKIFEVVIYSSAEDFNQDIYQHPKHVSYSKAECVDPRSVANV